MGLLSAFTTTPDSTAHRNDLVQIGMRSPAYDAVDKMRVSTPQSLIDTDFEYGQQAVKWEQLSMQNNRASLYYLTNAALPVSAIAGNQAVLYQLAVTFSSNVTIATGAPIFIQDALDPNASGWGYVYAGVSGGTSITVQMAQQVTTATCFSATQTYMYLGYTYTGAGIALSSTSAFTNVGAVITCTTQFPHGLGYGSLIYITGTTGPSTATAINGPQIVTSVPTANSFTFTNPNGTPSASVVNATGQTNLFARPSGWVDTHAYDGSVNFTAGSTVPNQILQRQTRRYFRYQSGKGIQFSTGTILKPQLQQPRLTSVGNVVTVTTQFPHNLTLNCNITVTGADQSAYNGTFPILAVPTATTFTYQIPAGQSPTSTVATSTQGFIRVSPNSWYGSSNKIGFFDQQNGLFFQFDGQQLYAVYRNSINQIVGTVSVTQGSGLVSGSNTQFSTQLVPGDMIVIRGQSYRVLTIANDTLMYISPEYRGATISNAIVSRTIDLKIPQSQWFDVLDGSGSTSNPSGYKLDLTKVQMFYIDYSWYGAGVARFGLRTTGGAITYVYTFQNNNVNYTAYMRSGNLPSHYEQNNTLPITTTTASIGPSDTTIYVANTVGFNPNGGTIRVTYPSSSGAIEYMTYTGLTPTTITGLTRAVTGGASSPQTFAYSSSSPTAVEYAAPDMAAMLSHWGSSVVMDGGFSSDISLLFNYGMTSAISTTSATPVPIMAIRLAPSVDNGTVGTLGAKEIINRLQMQMKELALLTTTSYLVQFILNGVTSGFSATFASPTQNGTNSSSIVQVATNTSTGASISGGESVAAFFTNTAGQTVLDLTSIAPFGNATLGGGISNSVPNSQAGTYPDGPDILYVVVTQIGGNGTAQARITWQESQA
jgi:hypothetical protein